MGAGFLPFIDLNLDGLSIAIVAERMRINDYHVETYKATAILTLTFVDGFEFSTTHLLIKYKENDI